jgi:uncharacterized protein (DUF1330 family)
MQEIQDVARYRNEYVPRVLPLLQKHGAELLVAGCDAETAEGEPPNCTVVIRFADTEAAWGFLNDPDYQLLLVETSRLLTDRLGGWISGTGSHVACERAAAAFSPQCGGFGRSVRWIGSAGIVGALARGPSGQLVCARREPRRPTSVGAPGPRPREAPSLRAEHLHRRNEPVRSENRSRARAHRPDGCSRRPSGSPKGSHLRSGR